MTLPFKSGAGTASSFSSSLAGVVLVSVSAGLVTTGSAGLSLEPLHADNSVIKAANKTMNMIWLEINFSTWVASLK